MEIHDVLILLNRSILFDVKEGRTDDSTYEENDKVPIVNVKIDKYSDDRLKKSKAIEIRPLNDWSES